MKERYLFKAKRVDNGEWVQGYLYGIWEKRKREVMNMQSKL